MNPRSGIEFQATVAPNASGGSVVTVFGELDIATADDLRPVLEKALDIPGDVEIDLRGVTFVDSSGIAVLVWAAWRLRHRDRLLKLRGARPRIRNIFDLAGLTEHSAVVIEPLTD
jgi:anti-sigma B factor antagonist